MARNKIRLISIISTIAASILASTSISRSHTWDDLWQSIRQSYQNSPESNISSNREPTTTVKCTEIGGKVETIDRNAPESTIFVGRQAVRALSKVYINGSSQQNCQIGSRQPDRKVLFVYAIADDSPIDRVRVSIYVNEQKKIEKTIARGRVIRFILDTKEIDRYTVKFETLDRRDGYIYIVESFDRQMN